MTQRKHETGHPLSSQFTFPDDPERNMLPVCQQLTLGHIFIGFHGCTKLGFANLLIFYTSDMENQGEKNNNN